MNPRRRRRSSRKRPSAPRFARRECRNSRICRCRRRTRSGRPAARPTKSIPQKTRMSLLQRLANVGLGRRDEETEPPIAARASGPAMAPMPPLPERKPQRSVAQQIAAHEPVSEYARRPAPQGLDAHGRPAPVAASATGRRSFGYTRLPAPPGQLKIVTNSDDEKGPGEPAGAFDFGLPKDSQMQVQATDIKS